MAPLTLKRDLGKLEPRAAGLPPREVQELWFATRRRVWKSLCLVPAAPGVSVLGIAEALAQVGRVIRRIPITVLKAEGMDLAGVAEMVMQITGEVAPLAPTSTAWTSGSTRGGLPDPISENSPVIIASESVVSNPLILAVALAADSIVLCVTLGETDLPSARHSIELIGRERLMGVVLVRPR